MRISIPLAFFNSSLLCDIQRRKQDAPSTSARFQVRLVGDANIRRNEACAIPENIGLQAFSRIICPFRPIRPRTPPQIAADDIMAIADTISSTENVPKIRLLLSKRPHQSSGQRVREC